MYFFLKDVSRKLCYSCEGFFWEMDRGYYKRGLFPGLECPDRKEIHTESRIRLSSQIYPLLAGGIGFVYCLLWFVLVYDDPISHPWINITERKYIISSLANQIHVRSPSISRELCQPLDFSGSLRCRSHCSNPYICVQVSPCKQPLPIKAMLRSLPLWSICVCGFGHQWLMITLMVYTPTYINSVFNINMRDVSAFSSMPFSSVHDPPIILSSQLIPSRKVFPLPLPQNRLRFNTNAGSSSKDMIEEATDFLQTMRSQDCQYNDQ